MSFSRYMQRGHGSLLSRFTYTDEWGNVPGLDCTVKAGSGQDVRVVWTELAVKYGLYMTLEKMNRARRNI